MFRKQLEASLKSIFRVKEVRLTAADYATPEQDCIFVEIYDAHTRPHGKDRISGIVKGALVIFSQDMRLPYGFFAKSIEQAGPSDTKDFFFEKETDVSAKSQAGATPTIQNLHERRVGFTYLFDTQYDPDRGELNAVDLSLEMEE